MSQPLLEPTSTYQNGHYGAVPSAPPVSIVSSVRSPGGGSGSGTVGPGGYEEFFGGTVACPTCRGNGRIPRDKENEMVALIPMNDKRLKPRRTVLYVFVSVVICALFAGMLLFFLFPRDVSLKSNMPLLKPTSLYINVSQQYMHMTIVNRYNISNSNFFSAKVVSLKTTVLFDNRILTDTQNKTVVYIPPRSQRQHYISMNITFADDEGYISTFCGAAVHRSHVLLLPFQATMNITSLGRSEQATLTTYQHVECSKVKM